MRYVLAVSLSLTMALAVMALPIAEPDIVVRTMDRPGPRYDELMRS